MTAALIPTASAAAAPAQNQERIEQKATVSQATDRVIVKFKAGARANEVAAKHGASVLKSIAHGEYQVLNVPAGQAEQFVERLSRDADVEQVEVDAILTANRIPNDPYYSYQWHLPKIGANYGWDITIGTTARTIAIIDSGVDLNHPDLAAKIVAGYDFVNNDPVADDDHGHGTHVAGTAAAITNNSTGIAAVDWNAKIMPIKALNAQGSGYTSDIIESIYFAADHGAHVINMSFGGGAASSSFQSAVNYAWNKGLVLVAAAGNSGVSTKQYPAAYNYVFSVAATDQNDLKTSWSNYGASWVDIAAPGISIFSTTIDGYTYMSGTSMASPIVAGAVSLAWSKNTGYSNAAVVDRICKMADPVPGTGTYWACGRVNLYKSVNGF